MLVGIPMRLLVIGLITLICAPSAASAQTSRDAGIAAFVRGDYVEAARIFGPLAEDAQSPDQAARLILGMLNDGGYAGQGGTLRACALYMSAAATPGPFTAAAVVLARMIREELGDGVRACEDPRFLTGPVIFRNGTAAPSQATEGFIALGGGEYDRAAALLKDIAEADASRDHMAQFLMGVLYQGGKGAPLDPLRACALYHRASIAGRTPLEMATTRLMRGLWREHDNSWFARCQALGNLGFDHGFETATYDLGAGRTITWDFAGATLTSEGRTQEFPWRGPRGAAYLPLQHTTLRSGALQERRDFFELLFWSGAGDKWELSWTLFEVDASQVRHVESMTGLLTSDHRPSDTETVDVRALVSLRVNDAGMVEWALLSAKPRRSATIESPNDRRLRLEDEAARQAALARVDWSRTFDLLRAPELHYERADGCRNVALAAFTADRAEAIFVRADRQALKLDTTSRTFDLAREAAISATVHVYEAPRRSSPFCTDVSGPVNEEVWRAVSGRMTIELSPPGVSALNPAYYRATIRIEGAEFVSPSGKRIRQSAPIVISALVGLMAG
jgi:hypothetical protein